MAAEPDYEAIWRHVEPLPWIALFTTGRVGSHLLHSFLDSHPNLFLCSGILLFHDYWRQSAVVAAGEFATPDLVDELIGHFMERLQSRYDRQLRADRLGERQDQCVAVDTQGFRRDMLGLLADRAPERRTVLRAFLVAYSLGLGQDPFQRTAFFDHPHHLWNLAEYLQDFPDCKLLGTTRDPRASWVSAVEHWAPHRGVEAHPLLVYFHFVRQTEDYQAFAHVANESRVIRLEDLGRREVLEEMCHFLGIPWDDCLLQSTWGGLRWWGDRVTRQRPATEERGFSPAVSQNQWSARLSAQDRHVLDYLWGTRLRAYGYPAEPAGLRAALRALWLLPRPMQLERVYSFGTLGQDRSAKGWARPLYYYLLRVGHCARLWVRRWRREPFSVRWIRGKGSE